MLKSALMAASLILTSSAAGTASAETSRQLQRLENYMATNRIGSFDDYWLAKKFWPDELVKLGLIFGYVDNDAACNEIAALLGKRYADAEYVCFRANDKLKPRPGG